MIPYITSGRQQNCYYINALDRSTYSSLNTLVYINHNAYHLKNPTVVDYS
jgi:hypothetical protein